MCRVRTPWVFPVHLHFGQLKPGLVEFSGAWEGSDSVSIVFLLGSILGVWDDDSREAGVEEEVAEEDVGGAVVAADDGVGDEGLAAEAIGVEGSEADEEAIWREGKDWQRRDATRT